MPLPASIQRLLSIAAASALTLTASAQPPDPFVGGDRTHAEILDRLESGAPRRFTPVGTSSVTLRVDLGARYDTAYKPRTRSHPRGYLSEIAAYRIARALGMDNVPPVARREMSRLVMQNRIELEHPEDWEAIRQEILWDAPGIARGAAIYWIPSMSRTELDSLRGLDAWSEWLEVGADVPPDRASIARDLSTMLAFDYLIGNWDRFSGGNVSATDDGTRLFVRDHNVGFQHPLTGSRYDRVRERLERARVFSRGFVERLRALDEATLRAALHPEGDVEQEPLLGPAQIEGILDRRRALLSYVAALVALHDAGAVLAFE